MADDEKEWMGRIEKIRADLSASKEQVVVPDYGAGDPNQSLSTSAMQAGRVTTEIVGEACRQIANTVSGLHCFLG